MRPLTTAPPTDGSGRLLLIAAIVLAACGNKSENKAGGAGTAKPVADVPAPTGSAVVEGVVKLDGPAPAPTPWAGAGTECKALHGDTIQLVKVADGKLEDVFVYVKAGLPKGSYPTPSEPVAFDQKGCEFTPRVFGIMAGQPLALGNSDRLMHNVKTPEFNQAFPFGAKREMKLGEPAVMDTIKCDVHPWMRAYAGVMEHPYFAVTKADGAFAIKGLVEGEYTLAAWHEKLGTQEIKAKAPGAVEIVFKPK
jgi:hypothetical protein